MNNFKMKTLTAACAMALMGGVGSPVFAAPGDTFTFTNCATNGRTGPTQGACDTAYTATSLSGAVTVAAGIQAWVVPVSATYRITALGAAGGTQTFGGPASAGGLGASIAGDVVLTAGETIFFLVGQKGENTRAIVDNAAPGGGGGTFVYRLATDAAPLIAAGGGGAGSSCTAIPSPALRNANATTAGNDSGSGANGGSAGNGGTNNVFPADYSYWAGGGTGWLTNGTGGDNPTNFDYVPGDSGAEGGRAARNGALGGIRWNDGTDEGGDGGFGGGGGGGSDNMGTGGGGGYSGGGGGGGAPIGDPNGANCNNAPGGGGGSFNGGANPVNTAAFNAGDGQVVVTQLGGFVPAVVQPVPTLSMWGVTLLAGLIGLFGAWRRRKA